MNIDNIKLKVLIWLCRLHGISHFDRDYIDWLEHRWRVPPGALYLALKGARR